MVLSEKIARLIESLLDENDGTLEIGRNELATRMGCVPSQINYVITSRFTPQKGYIVESRRGGGGFVRITKVKFDRNSYLMHFFNAVGDSIDHATAEVFALQLAANMIVTPNEAKIIIASISDAALEDLPRAVRNTVRASIFKAIILKLI
ncbi:MAG: CtsR family transcriptional regulator [Ruminococcaceae bacterium]|nr:CtsR family transcriptional regulator [Oscillospiraceae bacterium]